MDTSIEEKLNELMVSVLAILVLVFMVAATILFSIISPSDSRK